MNSLRRVALTGVGVATAAVTLIACGGSSSPSSSSSSASSTASTAKPSGSGSARAGRGGGFGADFSDPAVQACLKAAGITVPTFSGRPSGTRPTGSFTGRPSGTRPTGSFTGRPSGAGGFGGQNSAELQAIEAALKACGITLPSRTPDAGATPSATPSS